VLESDTSSFNFIFLETGREFQRCKRYEAASYGEELKKSTKKTEVLKNTPMIMQEI